MGLGVKLSSSALKINKNRGLVKGKYKLITGGPYKIVRHPMMSAVILIMLGLAFVFDSFVSLVFSPFVILTVFIECYLEEKYMLLPLFGKEYEVYKEKTIYKLIPTPYNILLIIIIVLVVYVGILNNFIST